MFPPDLPPVTNKALYAYRVFSKVFSLSVFGIGCLVLTLLIFPFMRLLLHPGERFRKYGRRLIIFLTRFYVFFMRLVRMIDVEIDTESVMREKCRNLKSKIIVANHPSLIDPIVIFSLLSYADTIVVPYRNNLFLGGIIRQLFIQGSNNLDDVLHSCTETLKQGNCLLIFPEGTRTKRSRKSILKKGAARVALASGCSIVPLHIGGTDKYGLGKKDPWFSYNPTERYVYRISMGAEIDPEKYRNLPTPAAAKCITEDMKSVLFPRQQD